jgi:hypothetical protein
MRKMTFDWFLTMWGYCKDCPADIDPKRWNAMTLWINKRIESKDWIDKEKIIIPDEWI